MRILAASLMVIGLAVVSNQAVAQKADKDKAMNSATKVDKFTAGKTLGANDVGFLNMVAETKMDKSRGKEAPKDVMMGSKKYSVGDKLTADDVSTINKAVAEYSKKHKDNVSKDEKKSRGSDTCYYYCYYDAYGNYVCYWYC